MSRLPDTIDGWADARLDEMLSAPRMWGSVESVEMQVLQLFEMRALARRPQYALENPRDVLDTYMAFLREQYPNRPSEPLHRLISTPRELVDVLRAFRAFFDEHLRFENPFEHSDLALRLLFAPHERPATSAITGYYEEFRRAARAVVREKPMGRTRRELEAATDFKLEDVSISPPNGSPAEAWLRLGTGAGQQDWDATNRVRDALSTLMTVTEWAGTTAPVVDLQFDDVERRTRTAVQARRLLPRRGINMVAIGGRLIARQKPVEIRANYDRRFVEVIGADATPEDFDATGEIRAIDLDQGKLVLSVSDERTTCYVPPEMLGHVASAGVEAHVVGKRFRHRLSARDFVLAESIEIKALNTDVP